MTEEEIHKRAHLVDKQDKKVKNKQERQTKDKQDRKRDPSQRKLRYMRRKLGLAPQRQRNRTTPSSPYTETPFLCHKCDKTFGTVSGLDIHIKKFHQ